MYSNQFATNNLILAQETQASKVACRIEVILERHAPEKLGKINALLRKYTGREVKLLHLIEQKYLEKKNETTANQSPGVSTALCRKRGAH